MRFIQLLTVSVVTLIPHLAFGQNTDISQQGLQAPPLMMIEDAKSQFQMGHLDEAVKDLQSASTLIRIESTTYTGSERATVEEFAAGFDRLSQDIKSGKMKVAKMFNQTVADITAAKAAFHVAQAKRVWLAKDAKRAGYELLAAAHAVEHSWAWGAAEMSNATKQSIATARAAAERLIEGKEMVAAEVEKAMRTLEESTEQLAKDAKAKS